MKSQENSIIFRNDKSPYQFDPEKLYISPLESVGSSEEGLEEFKSSCFRCLRVIHPFMYYSFTYPYKMVVDKEQRRVTLTSSGLRLVIWGILQASFATVSINSVRHGYTFKKRIVDDPTQLFVLAGNCIWLLGTITWPFCVICKKEWVCQLMAHSCRLDDGFELWSRKRLEPFFACLFCAVGFVLPLAYAIPAAEQLISTGKIPIGFLESLYEPPEIPVFGGLVAFLLVIFNTALVLSQWMPLYPGIMGCSLIYTISRDYLRQVDNCLDDDKRFQKVLRTYKVVKDLVADVNRVSSFSVSLLVVSVMADFCNDFTFLIGDKSTFIPEDGGFIKRIALITYFTLATFTFGLAAEARNKFQKTDQYILAKVGKVNNLERKVEGIILQNDISQNPVGVLAHHFILSYSLIATILSTVLTYVFILLQFQSSSVPNNSHQAPSLQKN